MSNRKWTSEYVRQRFPVRVRELRRKEGKPTDVKPTHAWLCEHGFIGIQNYAQRENKTVDDVLLEECGFAVRDRKPLPGSHAETKELIRQWLQDEEEAFDQLNDISINNAWTHMRRLIEISQEALGSSNLLRPARASQGKGVRLIIDLFRRMNSEFNSGGGRYNYASSLKKFYAYLEMFDKVEHNPAKQVLPKMGWSYNRESPKETLSPAQVKDCWEATQSIDEDNLEDLDSDELRTRLVEKILLLCLAGCGHRTSDVLIPNAQEDVILDRGDPRIYISEERKNGSGTTPIMAGVDYFEQYIELLEAEGYEMLFPSSQSADGTRSDTWVRNQIENIVDRAGVRFSDGSKPTPKDFRRFWYSEYIEAYDAYLNRVEVVADEQSSASADIVDQHYVADIHSRDHFRRFSQRHFEEAFPRDTVITAEEIKTARDAGGDGDEGGSQHTLNDFNSATPGGAVALIAETRWQVEREAAAYTDGVMNPNSQNAATLALAMGLAAVGLAIASSWTGDVVSPSVVAGAALGGLISIHSSEWDHPDE